MPRAKKGIQKANSERRREHFVGLSLNSLCSRLTRKNIGDFHSAAFEFLSEGLGGSRPEEFGPWKIKKLVKHLWISVHCTVKGTYCKNTV